MEFHPPRITARQLAGGAADAPLLDDCGAVDTPMMVVDLSPGAEGSDDAAVLAAAARRARAADRILVGVSGGRPDARTVLTDELDVTYSDHVDSRTPRCEVAVPDVDRAVDDLAARVSANPQAAVVLRQVLRSSGGLDTRAAVDVESLAYSTLLGGPEFGRWLGERGDRPPPPAPDREPVLMSRDGDRLRITLNRPERRNAYGARLRDALTSALSVATSDPSITEVVLDGAGPAFCAGGDLDEFGTTPDLALAHLIRTRAGAGLLVHELADRIEVHVHGACVGGGIEIPAFAGRVVASTDAWFRLPEVEMGLIPGAGGTVSIPRRIGRWRAMHLFVTGARLDSYTALDWGLVDAIH
ncbi:enoyl-CoA hydratase/isomerase family protein [Prescottella equi]|uniref:enoyl-CoA hydratase/isomerase family protein n=1 Tax=Rhodococcus hoagii TaxID=43767 RepID=UPI000A0F5633|nr:enoyl-CoA hydratase/isomerase family protein [Prescottella equi]MBM4555236.1 enoyl-CoA hydratase/isomerase family protein [Prescottella equi]NKS79254.1 enoyl-CoA hydratase/isomerase family protein [Prescottella equi]NKZ70846.1 enoyl-CoA hydratase/isomerase family protein [Prescottella equi]ORL92610.1 enoyl-CoA hydratase [Prescottella equi]QDP08906.1 enoyl-CoA hydratase/isomerase family protein [Prescottella equi]